MRIHLLFKLTFYYLFRIIGFDFLFLCFHKSNLILQLSSNILLFLFSEKMNVPIFFNRFDRIKLSNTYLDNTSTHWDYAKRLTNNNLSHFNSVKLN
jgi:hypothetical protein